MNISNIAKLFYVVFLFALAGFSFNFSNENNLNAQANSKPWIAPKSADKVKNPLKGSAKSAKEGKQIFSTYCAVCHGDKGEGNGPSASALNPKPKNLTAEEVQDQTDGAIFWKITTGNPPMLSWKSSLTDKQRWELVDYIRELKKK